MKLNHKNSLHWLAFVTLVLGAGWALAPASEPVAPPAPASSISSVSQKRLDPTTVLGLAAPGGTITKVDQYILTVLPDYFFTTDANGQDNLVVAIAYSSVVPGQDLHEIPPFLAHDAAQPPTMLFSDGHQSVASQAIHFPCSLVGFDTRGYLQYAAVGMTCPGRTTIHTLLLVFPVQQEFQPLELLLDGGKYVVILP